MIKVSVVIPVYNVEKYLPACLDSVLGQSLQEIECICIDDASPDHCGEMLDSYAAKDKRVHVLHLKENHMQGYGRNRGLEMATGKFVYFLDSDDMITPSALEELYTLAEQEDLDAVFFDSQIILESEEFEKNSSTYISMRSGNYPAAPVRGTELLDEFLRNNEWMVYVQRQFWRREFLIRNEVFFPENRTEHEDEFFSFAGILLAERAKYVRKNYFVRRYRANSVMTRKPHPKDFHGYFVTYYKMAEFVEKHGLSSQGIDMCMLHMYDCVLNFFGDFEQNARPADWFTPMEQELYCLFRTLMKSKTLADKRYLVRWEPLKPFRELKIYGAGRIGRSVHAQLTGGSFPVTGFLVTDREGNPDFYAGLPVQTIEEIKTMPEESAVVVAMSRNMQPGPAALLEQRGICYFLYAQGELTGPYGKKKQ